jgi:hypothetical protein
LRGCGTARASRYFPKVLERAALGNATFGAEEFEPNEQLIAHPCNRRALSSWLGREDSHFT